MDKANEVIENLKEDKAQNIISVDDGVDDGVMQILHTLGLKTIDDLKKMTFGSNSYNYNPAQSVIDGINQNIKQITQSTNIKPTVSVGELSLNIQTPVGTIEDIAKHAATGVLERAERQLMMEIPNAFQKEMYSNLK